MFLWFICGCWGERWRRGGRIYWGFSPFSDFEPQLGTGVQQSNNITTNSDKTTLLIILRYHISARVKENNDVMSWCFLNRKIILWFILFSSNLSLYIARCYIAEEQKFFLYVFQTLFFYFILLFPSVSSHVRFEIEAMLQICLVCIIFSQMYRKRGNVGFVLPSLLL